MVKYDHYSNKLDAIDACNVVSTYLALVGRRKNASHVLTRTVRHELRACISSRVGAITD
eukprot:SAG11_NODE_19999_length_454_cov_2.039437_1_plen_58_part_10